MSLILILTCSLCTAGLDAEFLSPPDDARPWVYWFWLNGNITEEGITADLEAIARTGIGGVLIMEVDQGMPRGPVDFMSDRWRELFHHVVSEADRLGLQVNMNNDAGWNGSGGPWVTPDRAMQKVVWSETTVSGPGMARVVLPQPETVREYYRDIAVLAFPACGDFRIENMAMKSCLVPGYVGMPSIQEVSIDQCIPYARIRDLTPQMDAAGNVAWEVPEGNWVLMRFGHTCTGVENSPSPESGRGLECDKLSPEGIRQHFEGQMAKLIKDAGPLAGRVLTATHIDSWENGGQNWTGNMREVFRDRRSYDLIPYLPILSGRVVESLNRSERFLWDLRMTISELVADNYAGELRRLAAEHGMKLTIEAYGCPCDDMNYALRCDEPMGEFWVGGSALNTCREMASAAHTNGQVIVGAEAFTAGAEERWLEHPATLKWLGDKAFCAGINRFIFHRYALQPWLNRAPGVTMGPWGTHYERTQTWWELSRPWHAYLSRCQHLLRQGRHVADVCFMQGETAPQGFHERNTKPYAFDACGTDHVMRNMDVDNGRITLKGGMSYALLALPPEAETMTPALAGKLLELARKGARIVGPVPVRAPTLAGYPACDEEVRRIGRELEPLMGGNVSIQNALRDLPPDFQSSADLDYIHRRDEEGDRDIYFVANARKYSVQTPCTFRVVGKQPEFWQPLTGERRKAALFSVEEKVTRVMMTLEASGSIFVVFEKPLEDDPVVQVVRGGKVLLDARSRGTVIKVLSAEYGISGDTSRTRDVTAAVQEIVDGGQNPIPVSALVSRGDPAPGMAKKLVVKFQIDDIVRTVTAEDGREVLLSEGAAPIGIVSAVYGVPGDPVRTRDVREKLQRLVDSGLTTFPVARMAEGDDPAFLVVKTLTVEYDIDGERRTDKGMDGGNMVLYEPAAEPPEMELVEEDGRILAKSAISGEYQLVRASGKTETLSVKPPRELTVVGPWQVHFEAGKGAPDGITLGALHPLNLHDMDGVRFFSGVAEYRSSFELYAEGGRVELDLGEVAVMAEVLVNGVSAGIAWRKPYVLDITNLVRPGGNDLTVRVANLWPNRLIGDEFLPEDSDRNPEGTLKEWPKWVLDNQSSPSGRIAFPAWRLWKKEETLPDSGLLGPVRIRLFDNKWWYWLPQ